MLTGSCLCGAVAYEADAPVERIVHCHCQTCRKTHGTAFSSVTAVPREKFRWIPRRGPAGRHRILARQVPPLLHGVRLAHHGRARGAAGRAAAAGLPRHAGDRSPAGPYLAIRRGTLVRPQAAVPREARGTTADDRFLAFHEDEPRRRPWPAPAPWPRRHPAVHARPASRVLRAAALLFVATPDADGWPMASVLTGEPGLRPIARSGDAASAPCRHRTIPPHRPSRRRRDRPARPRLHHAAAQPRQRPAGRDRRRRAHRRISQSFGNCPQYIQTRTPRRVLRMPRRSNSSTGSTRQHGS